MAPFMGKHSIRPKISGRGTTGMGRFCWAMCCNIGSLETEAVGYIPKPILSCDPAPWRQDEPAYTASLRKIGDMGLSRTKNKETYLQI